MRDLQTLICLNAYVAEVEQLKAKGEPLAEKVWPSDAPPLSRMGRSLEREETHRLRSWNRRLALLRSAQKRKLDARSRVHAAAARVLGADSLANRAALVRALAAEAEL